MFNFFKKESPKIIVKTPAEYYVNNIREVLDVTRPPDWLKNLKTLNPTPDEIFESKNIVFGNIKNCPAVIDLLKNTLSIKAPADLFFEYRITDNGMIGYRYICPWKCFLHPHDLENQAGEESVLNKYYINTKIVTPFKMYSNRKIRLMYLDPWLHTYSPINVISGMLELTPNWSSDLNINYLIPKERVKDGLIVKINKGDVLAYLYSPDFKAKDIQIVSEYVSEETQQPRFSFVNDHMKRTK